MKIGFLKKNHLTSSSLFLICYLLLLFVLPIALSAQEKGHWELWINDQHTPFLDQFFKILTNLGDGLVALFFVMLLLLFRYGDAALLVTGFVVHAVLVHLCKKVWFPDSPRPVAFFDGEELHRIEGVTNALYHSFPSGHTASIFLYVAILLIIRPVKQQWQFFYFVLAVLVAFSRVYLLQHFIWDVYVGSMVGIFSAIVGYLLLYSFPHQIWWDKRLEITSPRLVLPRGLKWKNLNSKD